MQLNEHEVDGIYDSAPTESTTVIHSTEDVDDVVQHEPEQQPAAGTPMGSVQEKHEEDTEIPEAELDNSMRHELARYRRTPGVAVSDSLVFHPEPERVRRPRDSFLALEDVADEYKVNDEDDPDNNDHFWMPSPKRPRVEEDGLLADAVLA